MKPPKCFLLLIALMILIISQIYSLEVPYLVQRVTDNAKILSPEIITELEQKLESHERTTSNQIAVLIVKSLEDEILEQFSMKVVESWKLGAKGRDNGVLLLISLDDRKIRIEVGYGLEGLLSDAICGLIIQGQIAPRFKERDFDGGVKEGVNAIIRSIEGNSIMPEARKPTPGKKIRGIVFTVIGVIVLLTLAFFMLLILMWLFRFTFLTQGWISWIFFIFFLPVYILIPWILITLVTENEDIWIWFFIIGSVYIIVKIWFSFSKEGKRLCKKFSVNLNHFRTKFSSSGNWKTNSSGSSSFTSYRSSSSQGWSSSSRSFSGGGGSFGGGGASGGW